MVLWSGSRDDVVRVYRGFERGCREVKESSRALVCCRYGSSSYGHHTMRGLGGAENAERGRVCESKGPELAAFPAFGLQGTTGAPRP